MRSHNSAMGITSILRWKLPSLMVYVFLAICYGTILLVAKICQLIPRRRWKPNGRIVATATFFNPNWYLSHVVPLTRSGVEEVVLVVDAPEAPLEKVRFHGPPKWALKTFGRALAKLLWVIIAGFRFKPDLYMGYFIIPGGCSALVAARLFGRPACYQMTAGPVEIVGGGYLCDHWFFRHLRGPSTFLERLAAACARQFDLVVVRGTKAKRFLADHGLDGVVTIITGSVNSAQPGPAMERAFDLVFLGRMSEAKQPLQFVEIVAEVRRVFPSVRAVMVGDGPLMDAAREKANQMGIPDCIEFLGKRKDPETILATSKVFVLTSQSEGLSIAMAEAMAQGAVPVVADVGELGDLVKDGSTGFLIEPDNIEQYKERIVSLLSDRELWLRCSVDAADTAARHCGVQVVAGQWRRHLWKVIDPAAGAMPQ